ncbi:MAG: hypothetical protein EZS28_053851, partial [Streblomastix strix]
MTACNATPNAKASSWLIDLQNIVDIAEPKKKSKTYNCNEDPTVFHSEKTNRGPLKLGWVQSAQSDNVPVTTAHKVAKMEFK